MAVAWEGGLKAADQPSIGMTQVRRFGAFVVVSDAVDRQPSARFAKLIPFVAQSLLKVFPSLSVVEVIREERPYGCDEPLIRAVALLRAASAKQIAPDRVMHDIFQRPATVQSRLAKRGVGRRVHIERDFFHGLIKPNQC